MWIKMIRIFYVLLGGVLGALIVINFVPGGSIPGGVLGGLLSSLAIVIMELRLDNLSLKETVLAVTGLAGGLLLAFLVALPVTSLMVNENTAHIIRILFYFFFGYVGMMLALEKREEIPLFSSFESKPKILDTSVIIDGRIADVVETGFVEGPFIIPRFVLQELQHIADSSDPLKRNRGRRGLDVLNRMQKSSEADIKIYEKDFTNILHVDEKLVELSKWLKASVVTNDFNLNKVAKLQGVQVLNMNDLAAALKPVVLPGEIMTLKVLKEGKEGGQGIGYLDDGTMIVVDNGKSHIGSTVDVVVTSVLQTTAGRMIFARMENGS
jgi:uncharacterized protein YacL